MGEKKKWTVMVYLSGDNNLSEECVWALKEMYRIGANDRVAVIAQYDSKARNVPTSRYIIGQNPSDGALDEYARALRMSSRKSKGSPLWQEASASARMLRDFIIWGADRFPADNYMVVLSGHGSGAEGDYLIRDDNPPSYLSIPRLRWALEEAKKKLKRIDILGLDACLMSTAEVSYEVKKAVRFLVGAEGFEPDSGWPYHRILETLNASPDITPRDLACAIVEKYTGYYSDYASAGVSVDLSACDSEKSDAVAEAVNRLAKVLRSSIETRSVEDAVLLAHWRAQSYKLEDYVDLFDFCDLLEEGCDNEQVKEACGAVKDAVESLVVKSCYSGAAFQYSRGISIYFPWAEVTGKYKNLLFSKNTKWDEFLHKYVEQTRREPRGGEATRSKRRAAQGSTSASEVRSVSGSGRFFPPWGKFMPPWNKGPDLLAKVKNPPITFNKDECKPE